MLPGHLPSKLSIPLTFLKNTPALAIINLLNEKGYSSRHD
jgi:hypothetical protein